MIASERLENVGFSVYFVQIHIPFSVDYPLKGKHLNVDVHKKKLTVGLKGAEPVIDGQLYNDIKVEETSWIIQDKKVVVIFLEKVSIKTFLVLCLFLDGGRGDIYWKGCCDQEQQ